MKWKRKRPLLAAAIIERFDNAVLIVKRTDVDGAPCNWQFPRGSVSEQESAEAAMRRIIRDDLGLEIEVVVGQPPLSMKLEGREVELRFFFCGVITGEMHSQRYAEIQWISKPQLIEFDFDEPSHQVAHWLAEGGR